MSHSVGKAAEPVWVEGGDIFGCLAWGYVGAGILLYYESVVYRVWRRVCMFPFERVLFGSSFNEGNPETQ